MERGSTEKGLRIHKLWSISMVEVGDALSCEFEVLRLVFADWDVCCPFSPSASAHSPILPPKRRRPIHTYEPKYPPPAKPDTRKGPVSTSASPSHQADSHRLLTQVYSTLH